jgi:formate--tetrahydrofolate ligase
MLTDIEIAQSATLKPIQAIAALVGLLPDKLIPYGHHIAKISNAGLGAIASKPNGKLILVTAINPTPAGEGKTTTTVGLTDALNRIGQKAMVCIREPSLGPVFGMKGGATGGGFAQVLPMENINLHFTGDFHAITSANNLLAALIDNHIYHGNSLDIDPVSISWRRCIDINDRALRHVHLAQQHHQTDTAFDITVASEVMAVFCLAENLADLKFRLGQMQVATSVNGNPVYVTDLKAEGAMTALLKEAFQPNLVQTIEGSPAMIHGGPFANIAHGCNSVISTKTALKLADYVVTEAGFGADLGAEKFFDIKCRQANLMPDAVVLVATVRAIKYHGGAALETLNTENVDFVNIGISNLTRHIDNLHKHFGMQAVVAINHFSTDTQSEIAAITQAVTNLGCKVVLCKHWAQGGKGAEALAHAVIECATNQPSQFKYLYSDEDSLLTKLEIIANKIYHANRVSLSQDAKQQLAALSNYQHLPICVAKTQYSFSCNSQLRNAPTNHTLEVKALKLSRGAGFVVAICGDIMTMPGLPKVPASERIDVTMDGQISGLS